MKRNTFLLLGVGFLLASDRAASVGVQTQAAPSQRAPVIVELFTSEGCSTCPPADDLLLQLEERQFIAGAEVIALEEHVDYWNHDGWIDPFSSVEWTARQQDYAAALKSGGVYTPQMVIDGREQFVGGRVQEVSASIGANALRQKARVTLSEVLPAGKQSRRFRVTVSDLGDAPAGEVSDVWLLITEKGLSSQVTGGENAGKRLRHASIVRWIRKIGAVNGKGGPAPFSADSTIKLKASWNEENLRAVALVQMRRTKQILGAASLALSR